MTDLPVSNFDAIIGLRFDEVTKDGEGRLIAKGQLRVANLDNTDLGSF